MGLMMNVCFLAAVLAASVGCYAARAEKNEDALNPMTKTEILGPAGVPEVQEMVANPFLPLPSNKNPRMNDPNKCPVEWISVTRHERDDKPKHGYKLPIDVIEHLGHFHGLKEFFTDGDKAVMAEIRDTSKLPFSSSKTGFFSCWDGRHDYAILGTPGGDLGEFLLGLNVLDGLRPMEQKFATQEQVDKYFDDYLSKRDKFYMHTDQETLRDWGKAANVSDPLNPKNDAELHEALKHAPKFAGCVHMNLMLEKEQMYETRSMLTEFVIRAALRVYITKAQGWRKIVYVVLNGYAHMNELAFVNVLSPAPRDVNPQALSNIPFAGQPNLTATTVSVSVPPKFKQKGMWSMGSQGSNTERTPAEAFPQLANLEGCLYKAPLVQPRLSMAKSVMVYHARAVYENRAQIARYFAASEKKDMVWMRSFFSKMMELGDKQMQLTKSLVASKLPTFIAEYDVQPQQ